jgi:hypothetical protein
MNSRPDSVVPRFGRYLAGLAFVSMLAFVFLNYRDPWPPLVPPPLAASPEVPTPPIERTLSLAQPPVVERGQPAPAKRSAEVDESVPATSLPLRLVATVVHEDPSRSLARIEDAQSSDAHMLLQGQAFEGRPGVTLVTIEPHSVLLDNYGTLERLPLEPNGLQFTADSLRSQ